MVSEARLRPNLLAEAGDVLIAGTYRSFAEWLSQQSGREVSEARSTVISTLAIGSLFSTCFVNRVLGITSADIDDDVARVSVGGYGDGDAWSMS